MFSFAVTTSVTISVSTLYFWTVSVCAVKSRAHIHVYFIELSRSHLNNVSVTHPTVLQGVHEWHTARILQLLERRIFTSKLDLNLRKKLIGCYTWIIALYCAKTLHTSVSKWETPGKFWNVVLQRDGKNQLDISCEKWKCVTKSQGGEEYPTNNKNKKD